MRIKSLKGLQLRKSRMKVLETTVVVTIILKQLSEKDGMKVEIRLFFLYYFTFFTSPVSIPTASLSFSFSSSCSDLPPVIVGLQNLKACICVTRNK